MKKYLLISLVLIWSITLVKAQLSFPGSPKSFKTEGLSLYVPTIDLPVIDNQKLLLEDQKNTDKGMPGKIVG